MAYTTNWQAQCGKIVIAVSQDIDTLNTDAIFWSMAYRTNPEQDLKIVPNRSRGHGPKSESKNSDSGILIDATLKQPMPPLALPTKTYMENALKIWGELDLPSANPRGPWHGYSLGDWDDAWDTFANNAVKDEWIANGQQTFERRKSGIKPETPVRFVEKNK